MTRLILQFLNGPALILLVALGVGIETSLFSNWPLNYAQSDVILVAVIWCALRRHFTEGGILTLFLADLAEIHSSCPQGLYLISYMAIFLLVRLSSRVFVILNLAAYTLLAVISSVTWKLICLAVLHLLGANNHPWVNTLPLLLPGAAVEGALAWWAFRMLERFDWVTYKSGPRQTNRDDDLVLQSEIFLK